MAAYVIGHITIKDSQKWAEYRDQVPATVVAWGGQVVFRGRRMAVFSGQHPFTDTVVIQFPDVGAVQAWHESAAYQALIPLRNQAADVVLVGYES
ncbi:MAG: DUF1330 domain-containing protein [Chloroflexi bacterium]|nr:DUF1330 domain-containing protein [Chloroflexota bacterium]